jgi:hypothetical protein
MDQNSVGYMKKLMESVTVFQDEDMDDETLGEDEVETDRADIHEVIGRVLGQAEGTRTRLKYASPEECQQLAAEFVEFVIDELTPIVWG